jgi:hypothetical protein
MIRKPEETRQGSTIPVGSIANAIRREIIIPQNMDVVRNITCSNIKVFSIEEPVEGIPLFTQFISLTHNSKPLIFVDTRSFKRSPTDELTDVLYGKIGSFWLDNQIEVVKNNTKLAGKAWVNLVSMAIGNAYNLDLEIKMKISLILGLYYESMFHNKEEVEPYRVRSSMGNYVSSTSTQVNDTCEKYDNYIGSIDELVAAISTSGPLSLQRFNTATLVTLTSRFYYGANAQLNMAIANEYIPRWTSIVGSALQSMSHGRSPLGEMTKKLASKDNQMANWLKSINKM